MTDCIFCGEEERIDVLEVEERGILLDCCCETMQDQFQWDLSQASRKDRQEWLRRVAGLGCRDILEGTTIDWGLRLDQVPQKVAKQFVRDHHSHCPPPAGWRWGHGVYNGDELLGVAMVGRPVARMIDHSQVVEVNRVCVSGWPHKLSWNACSMLYGAAAREASQRGFNRIITYTLENEPATALTAVGWAREQVTAGGSWNRAARKRKDKSPICRKVRWGKQLNLEAISN
jgi:hypothetical protein